MIWLKCYHIGLTHVISRFSPVAIMSGDIGNSTSKEEYEIEEWDRDGSFLTIIIRGSVDIKKILENEEYEDLEILQLKFEGIESPNISSLFDIEVDRLMLESDDALELDFSKLEQMTSGFPELWIGFDSITELNLSPLRNMTMLSGVSIGGRLLERIDFGPHDFSSLERLSASTLKDTLTITGFDKVPNLTDLSILGEFREVVYNPLSSEEIGATLIVRKIPIRHQSSP